MSGSTDCHSKGEIRTLKGESKVIGHYKIGITEYKYRKNNR